MHSSSYWILEADTAIALQFLVSYWLSFILSTIKAVVTRCSQNSFIKSNSLGLLYDQY